MATPSTVNVAEAKTHLSRLLAEVEHGAEITIARAGRPVARLVPITELPRRRCGVMSFEVPEDFDQPLSEGEIAAWE